MDDFAVHWREGEMKGLTSWAAWALASALLCAGCGDQAEAVRAPGDESDDAKSPVETKSIAPRENGGPNGTAADPAVSSNPSDPGIAVPGTGDADPPAVEPAAPVDPLAGLPDPRPASPQEQIEIGRQLEELIEKAEVPADVPEALRHKLDKAPLRFENGKIVYVQLSGSVRLTDERLKLLEGLDGLKSLSLGNAPHITSAGLVHLRGLASLEKLVLNHNRRLDDQALACLRRLTNLKQLELVDTSVSDAGLVHLAQLTRLETLKLQGTKVSDAGLSHLRGLSQLKDLWLQSTRVGAQAAEALQRDLPNLKFVRLSGRVLKADGS
jgi:hypothetical protein